MNVKKAQMERLIDSLLKKHTQRDKERLNPYMFWWNLQRLKLSNWSVCWIWDFRSIACISLRDWDHRFSYFLYLFIFITCKDDWKRVHIDKLRNTVEIKIKKRAELLKRIALRESERVSETDRQTELLKDWAI